MTFHLTLLLSMYLNLNMQRSVWILIVIHHSGWIETKLTILILAYFNFHIKLKRLKLYI